MNTTNYTMPTPSRPSAKTTNPDAAVQFMEELLEQHETLNDIAIQHGSRTLADLMYMQQAILTGGFVDAWPDESGLISVLKTLPSVEHWRSYVVAADPSIDLDAHFGSSSSTASAITRPTSKP
ncbi:Uncharacterised protein [Achromobacter sp. 2789STDY5608633]|uniref:hypothetical protein n=1 Tax=Achromobacter sp. 2789STDY5608633 TaxID=1806501 RepID=UPI0006C311C9|nr:hypothetical protein [Achromobacter sp. 2789STDY5608633]CUJ49864.1 Uncharacterised protein [Achromobacter sp. 2789STDY5608633]